MKAIQRLFIYLNYKDLPHTRFEKEAGLSNGYLNTQLKREADLGEGTLLKIIDKCLDLNPIWLLTGNGDMIKEDFKPTKTIEKESEYDIKEHLLIAYKQIDLLEKQSELFEKQIKLLEAENNRLKEKQTN